MGKKKRDKGEFILLGFFGIFIVVYLIDISRLPMEGKLLSYVLAPFIFLTIILCLYSALAPSKKEEEETFEDLLTHASHPEKEEEKKRIKKRETTAASKRLYKTAAIGTFLFGSIYLLGFYLGSGVMLLVWFSIFKRINLTTLLITVLTPLLIYLPFEKLLNMGLPKGALFQWLGY